MQVEKGHVVLTGKRHEPVEAFGKVEERHGMAALAEGLGHGGRTFKRYLALGGPAARHKKYAHSFHQKTPILSKMAFSTAFARFKYPVIRALRSSSMP